MAEFRNPPPINRITAEKAFAAGIAAEICDALASVVLHEKDWRWSQAQCLHFLNHANPELSGLAATCLGHIARIHRQLDRDLVITALRKRLDDPEIGGRVQDALDDIQMFVSK